MALGSLFENYDKEGALNGMFAPAYIAGYQPAEDAVMAYNAKQHALTPEMLEQTRMPVPPPPQGSNSGVFTVRGGGSGGTTSNLGTVDPEALRVLAQGGSYDMEARRNAIAKQVAQNASAAPAQNANRFLGPMGVPLMRDPNSQLLGLMGDESERVPMIGGTRGSFF